MKRPRVPPLPLRPQHVTSEMVAEWDREQRVKDVDARIDEAARQALATDAQVQALSQERLTDILRLGPSQRFEHVNDVDLIPEHRREVIRSLQAASRSLVRTVRLRLRFGWAPVVRRMVRSRVLRGAGVSVLGLGLFINAAARHDGRIAVLDVPFDYYAIDSTGNNTLHNLAPGAVLIVADIDEETVMARRWWPGLDYFTVPIPRRDVTFSLARSISPAYDVILDVLRSVMALRAQPDPTKPPF